MPQEEYVVKFNETTNLYLTVYHSNSDNHEWGNAEDAIKFETLGEAQSLAAAIGGGTVGTTKPH